MATIKISLENVFIVCKRVVKIECIGINIYSRIVTYASSPFSPQSHGFIRHFGFGKTNDKNVMNVV
jgi:hypothetical protein